MNQDNFMTTEPDPDIINFYNLVRDIEAMRNMVLYYENRILRKEIAIQEILNSKECREDSASPPPPQPIDRDLPKGQSVRAMIEEILPELKKDVFWYSDIKPKCLDKYPEYDGKIRRGIYPACLELIKTGVLEKCPGGLRKKAQS